MAHLTIVALIFGTLFRSPWLLPPGILPIRALNLTTTVSKIGQGNLETDIHEIVRSDEIGILARGIAQMQNNLRDSHLDLELRISRINLGKRRTPVFRRAVLDDL